MFGVGTPELVVAGALLVAVILATRLLGGAQWVRVDRTTPVGVEVGALEVPLARLLSGLPGTRLVAGGPSTWTVSVERAQSWAFVPAVLLFPIGPLFLLFREHASLVVSVRSTVGGAEVCVLGTTRVSVRATLEHAIAELPASMAAGSDAATRR